MITETVSASGFSPEPEHGKLITGLLDAVASQSLPAVALAQAGAERLCALVGDTCVVSLAAAHALEPIALADVDADAATALEPVLAVRVPAAEGHDLGAYAERFGLGAECTAPMRARGRVLGQLLVLRRGHARPFSALELRLIQAVADVLALGVGAIRPPTGAAAPEPGATGPAALSPREREILSLLALGHTNREIAERVHLSVRTVEWHRARIQGKLGVTGRAALAQVARTHGLLDGAALDDLG